MVGMATPAAGDQLPTGGSTGKPIRHAYVGCRTTRARNARGNGLTVFAIDAKGSWTQQQLFECENPAFLAFDRTGRMLYAVHGDMTDVSAFRIDKRTGGLQFVNKTTTNGRNPVHLAPDPTNRFLVVANHVKTEEYPSNVSVLTIARDGSLGAVLDTMELPGKIGPHRTEQPFSKPHQVLFDPSGRFIAVPDKGLDRIFTLTLTPDGKLQRVAAESAKARESSGPRHVIFHPTLPFLFVINELSSTVLSCKFDPATGEIRPIQEISAIPDTYTGPSRAAEIDISTDGRFVYASNRVEDSIASYTFDGVTGRLAHNGWTKSMGQTPRFFNLSPAGNAMFVANEESDTIVRFLRHADNGVVARGEVVAKTGSPTCILFA